METHGDSYGDGMNWMVGPTIIACMRACTSTRGQLEKPMFLSVVIFGSNRNDGVLVFSCCPTLAFGALRVGADWDIGNTCINLVNQ